VEEEVGARSSNEVAEAARQGGKEEEAERWGPLAVGMGKAPRAPENAAPPPLSCKKQYPLRLLLEPLQCASDLHFADVDAFTATAGDGLMQHCHWRLVSCFIYGPLGMVSRF
jgi:hypothetical protein